MNASLLEVGQPFDDTEFELVAVCSLADVVEESLSAVDERVAIELPTDEQGEDAIVFRWAQVNAMEIGISVLPILVCDEGDLQFG